MVERYGSEAAGAPKGARMDLNQVNLDVDNTGARASRAGVVNSSTRFLLLRRALGKKISGEELKTAQNLVWWEKELEKEPQSTWRM